MLLAVRPPDPGCLGGRTTWRWEGPRAKNRKILLTDPRGWRRAGWGRAGRPRGGVRSACGAGDPRGGQGHARPRVWIKETKPGPGWLVTLPRGRSHFLLSPAVFAVGSGSPVPGSPKHQAHPLPGLQAPFETPGSSSTCIPEWSPEGTQGSGKPSLCYLQALGTTEKTQDGGARQATSPPEPVPAAGGQLRVRVCCPGSGGPPSAGPS